WPSSGIPLCAASGDQLEPAITTDGRGGAIVTWTDYRNGAASDIYAGRVNKFGDMPWGGNGIQVCGAAGQQNVPAVVSDGAGGAIVTWEDNRSGTPQIYLDRIFDATASGVGSTPSPIVLDVSPNYPNPFNTSTEMDVRLNKASNVTVDLFDVSGRRVR